MKELIYIGEKFPITIPAYTKIIIGNKLTTIYEVENESSTTTNMIVDTIDFIPGDYAVVYNENGVISISAVKIVDPLASMDALNDALTMIKEIDQVLEDRAKNAISQITINNKTIVNSSLESLMSLRAMYIKKVNKIRGRSGVFKSVTVLKGK
ncbi:MAG: hypothetical protein K0S95_744 [Pantoea eucrina]|jgi:hypothetical protein|nr:hypothetical protein [Pantoea eucrina]